jgi:tRNA U34 5-methylaminomethyl-2-thiouridine-forming methyltransferase MnmC
MANKIHETKDGSSTLYSDEFEQFYHNPNGAASESIYVFFETSGLIKHIESADSLTILEVGFGTGLNVLLLADIMKRRDIKIPVTFWSVEAFPVTGKTAAGFNFTDHLEYPELNECLPQIFDQIKPGLNTLNVFQDIPLTLNLFYGKFEKFKPENIQADFIFHDPFSPEVNEELWDDHTFKKLANFSNSEVVLATYCAASKARGAMCAAGWNVAKTRGALGKREMTLASLSGEKLANFKRVNETRLAERYQTGDFN